MESIQTHVQNIQNDGFTIIRNGVNVGLFYISGMSSPNSTLYPALIIDIW